MNRFNSTPCPEWPDCSGDLVYQPEERDIGIHELYFCSDCDQVYTVAEICGE